MSTILQATVEVGKTYQEALTAAGASGNPTRTNYTFLGWNTQADGSGTTIQLTDVVTATIRIYAQWAQYKIYYDKNNENATGTMEPSVQTGSSVVVKSCAYALSGYSFTEWATTPSSPAGARYNPGDTITLSGDITLYARWEV